MSKNEQGIREIIDRATTDIDFRISLTRESFYWFLVIYFSDYLDTGLAPFHKEIINTLQRDDLHNYALAAFRSSGKSTIVSTAFILWEILGKHNKKFIVLISNTSRQSETHFQSIKESLERNELLKNDMGPFKELADKWNSSMIVFTNYKAKVMASSINESLRGIRYLKYRPQVIVCDDVETLEIIRSSEGKQKLNEWFDRDIKPLGTENTKVLVVGTFLTDGSLLENLRVSINEKTLDGVFHKFPIVIDDEILWKAKWPTFEDLNRLRTFRGLDELTWQTEYLLNPWTGDNPVITKDMIHTYGLLPNSSTLRNTYVGVDLAVTEKQSADYTAIVVCEEHYIDGEQYIYVLPQLINQRMAYPKTKDILFGIYTSLESDRKSPVIIMEGNATLKGFAQDIKQEIGRIIEFQPGNQDKEARLWRVSGYFANKRVFFPSSGAEPIIKQLLNFKLVKQHDDLIDALVMILSTASEQRRPRIRVFAEKPEGF